MKNYAKNHASSNVTKLNQFQGSVISKKGMKEVKGGEDFIGTEDLINV